MQGQGNKAIYQGFWDTVCGIIRWVLKKNDIYMGKITKWLADTFSLSLLPTQSRWGIISILSSLALFFIALFPALFLFSQEGEMNHGLLYGAIAIASIGGLIALFTLSLSVHFLRNQKEDVLIKGLNEMKTDVASIRSILEAELPLLRKAIESLQAKDNGTENTKD